MNKWRPFYARPPPEGIQIRTPPDREYVNGQGVRTGAGSRGTGGTWVEKGREAVITDAQNPILRMANPRHDDDTMSPSSSLARTPALHAENVGSTPTGDTKNTSRHHLRIVLPCAIG